MQGASGSPVQQAEPVPLPSMPRACPPAPPQVHPGGLIDEEGGKRQLIIDVDDKLISEGGPLMPLAAASLVQTRVAPDVVKLYASSWLRWQARPRTCSLCLDSTPAQQAPSTGASPAPT